MKTFTSMISMMALSTLLLVVPILAADNCPVSSREFDKLIQSNFKDQCLIVAKNCATQADTVQQRVNALRVEIAKGQYVYTNEELKALKEQLRWIQTDSYNQVI